MRLYQKAAVCLLAAAMAVSMMTACGGGAASGGNPEDPDSKPGVTDPENPGDGKDDNKDDDKKDDTALPDLDAGEGVKIAWQNSRTAKASSQLNANRGTVELEVTTVSNGVVNTQTETIVKDSNKQYAKVLVGKNAVETLVIDKDFYIIYRKSNAVVKYPGQTGSTGTGSGTTTPEIDTAISIEKGTKTIGGTPYYAEKVTAIYKENGKTQTDTITYCYSGDSLIPTYLITDDMTLHILKVSAEVNQSLLQLPAGYTVYTIVCNSNGEIVGLKDSNGQLCDNWQNILMGLTDAESGN